MLNIAVLSDIHGNDAALQTCLDHALHAGADTFLFLGDYVGELVYPQKTIEILYAVRETYRCFFIRGNKEGYWLEDGNGQKDWKEYDSTTGCLFYAYQNLKQRDLQFFQSLPIKEALAFANLPPLTACHGSPRKVNEKLLPGHAETYAVMEQNPHALILCGHTHIQGRIMHNGKTVLNAGSVGVPLGSHGKTQFMLLRGTQGVWDHEFVSLPYDVERVASDLYASGLMDKAPYWCKVTEHVLRTGEVSHAPVLARAMELCEERYGVCNWPEVPEECWEQAVREFGIC